jgi:hypothetical protein
MVPGYDRWYPVEPARLPEALQGEALASRRRADRGSRRHAELDGTCIMVSCKSRVYTADYDRGLYRVVRNTADYISHAVEDWEALLDRLRRNPVGDNYDLSAADDLRG